MPHAHPSAGEATRAGLDIGEIFERHEEEARRQLFLSAAQRRVMRRIITCRTAALGGHLEECSHCDAERPAYNSCRDRHCPKCQAPRQAQWVALRLERIVPVPHFHVVFTLPGILRPLAKANPDLVYDLILRAASKTLMQFGRDPKWLGAQLGVTAILHTWRRDLGYHPHVHCVVTAGGLSTDGRLWIQPPRETRFLFPVAALAKVFRGKFLEALAAHEPQSLDGVPHDPARFDKFWDRLHRRRWHVYAKRPLDGSTHLFRYLGRYTHRVAISNQRLIAVDDKGITFATKDGGQVTLPPMEFIRRFLDHVLPDGFTKIRHYGLYAGSHVNGRLIAARALVGATHDAGPTTLSSDDEPEAERRVDIPTLLFGEEFLKCPVCKVGRMQRVALLPVSPPVRGPP